MTAVSYEDKYRAAVAYIRAKVDQLLGLMGTLPLRPEELDDEGLIELDPIGIIGESFGQVLAHLNETNLDLRLARNEIRAILDTLQAAVVVEHEGCLADCNRSALDWFFGGADIDAVRGRPLGQLCLDWDTLVPMRECAARQALEVECQGRQLQLLTSCICDEHGVRLRTVYLFFDISRLKAAEQGLRLYAEVFSHTHEGILITDRHGCIVDANAAFCRITGYPLEAILGRTLDQLHLAVHDGALHAGIDERLRENGHWGGEVLYRRRDGSLIPLLQNINVVRGAAGEITHTLTVITDITVIKENQARLDFLAYHDVLTELPNRLLFRDRLEQALQHARRDGERLGLLFIDLDRFKNINDSLGHHVGDQLLVAVAQRLRKLLRRTDTIARLGGDEFVVLTEKLGTIDDADRLAHKIITALRRPFDIGGRELHVGCSIGITLFPEDGESADELLRNADTAMYRAKDAGRDGFARFSREWTDDVTSKLVLENDLRVAVRQRRLSLHYQPIVSLSHGRVIAAEALARWPDAPSVPPDRFIALAEETRLILPLGEWILHEALRQYAAWRSEGLILDYISVNISAMQLASPEFTERLLSLLRVNGLEGRHLQIELTENILMRDTTTSHRVLGDLRSHGIRIAIDDFGTGYSSLAYLKRLPIDNLKVDRSFVHDIPADPNDCAIAAAIIGLARTLGLEAIAEGIESEAQERFLREIGCDTVQGYRYARPLPAERFRTFVAAYGQDLAQPPAAPAAAAHRLSQPLRGRHDPS
ncbi:MAG: EAL domain-containing protein [Myxococcales bacterium]|nr:EAL domain-containing protein [Myxococcota bacterium]MDW8284418.1 EAL domain-containing protein [Myxococcales bacterium]